MLGRTLAGTGPLPLRLGVGITFFMHGWMKLSEMGVANVTGFFGSLGIPLPAVAAPAIIALEIGGGAALILGLLTRPIAALLACDMLVAIPLVKLGSGFFAPQGPEVEFLLLTGALTLALTGAGWLSVDALLFRRRGSPAAAPESSRAAAWV